MVKYGNNQLSLTQYILFIYKTQVGYGILTLPRDLAEEAGTDGWIAVVLGWMLAVAVSLIIIRVMEKHPGDTLFDLLPKYFGKWLGNGLSILWILYFAASALSAIFTTIYIIQVWILPNTAQYLLLLLFIIPIYMITSNGIKVIGRFAEVVFLVTLWMPPILFFSLEDIHLLNFLPIAREGWMPIIGAVKTTVLSFLGFEMAFILYPFLKEKKSAYKGIIIANTMSMFIFLAVTLISFARFSPEEVKVYVWPTLNLLKLIRFTFLERLEIIFLSFYLFVLFMTVIPYLYTAVFGVSRLLGRSDHRPYLRIFVLLSIALSILYIPTYDQVLEVGKWQGRVGGYISYLFPVLLLIYSWVFFKFRKGRQH